MVYYCNILLIIEDLRSRSCFQLKKSSSNCQIKVKIKF